MIRKSVRYDQRFDKVDVFIEDTEPSSNYFRISDLPDVLAEGKNAFLINGSKALDPGSPVKVQIIGPDGKYIWAQPIQEYLEGKISRLVQVEVYPDQIAGPAKIVVLGKARRTINGQSIPARYKDAFNVRWTKQIRVDPDAKNGTTIRFKNTPSLQTTELRRPFINKKYIGEKTASIVGDDSNEIRVRGFYDANTKNYQLASENFKWTQEHANTGNLFVSRSDVDYGGDNSVTGSYDTEIDKIISEKYAIASKPLVTLQEDGGEAISDFGFSKFTLTYEGNSEYEITENVRSFINVGITDMETLSGDVDRVKLYQKSRGSIGDYQIVADQPLESKELFIKDYEDSGSVYKPKNALGKFYGEDIINNYWQISVENYTGSVDFERDSRYLGDALEISASLDRSDDSKIIAQPTVDVNFDEGVPYQLAVIPFSFKNLDGEVDLEVYMSGSAFYGGTRYGKRVMTASFSSDTKDKRKFFGDLNEEFLADKDGSGRPVFVVKKGNWYLRNISIREFTSTGFSPNTGNFLIPVDDWSRNDQIRYKAEFYDPFGNKADTEVFSSPTEVTGSNTYLEGLDNLLSGSFFVGNEIGGGVSIAGYAGANIRSIGYDGFYSASNGGPGGFLMWSGSFMLTDPDGTAHPRYLSGSQSVPYQGVGVEFHGGTDNGKPGHALSFDTVTGQLNVTGSINITNTGDVADQIGVSTQSINDVSQSLSEVNNDQILTALEKRQVRDNIWRAIVSGSYPELSRSYSQWNGSEFPMLSSPWSTYDTAFDELYNYLFDDTTTQFLGSGNDNNPGWMAGSEIGNPFFFSGSTTDDVDSRTYFESIFEHYFDKEGEMRDALVSASEGATFTNPQGKLVKPPQQSGEGLFLGSTNLGFYSESLWQTYMDNKGQFYLTGSDGGGYLFWDPAQETLAIKGSINIIGGNTRDEIDNIDTSASASAQRFEDISDDQLIDESELPRLRDLTGEIENENANLVFKANYLGITNELNNYTASYNELSSSLNTILTAGSYPYDLSNITTPDFQTRYNNYFDDKADLVGTFGSQVSDDINARFNDVADDNLADESEVPKFKDMLAEIDGEYPRFVNRAQNLAITNELNDYTASYDNFSSSLNDVITAGSYPYNLSSTNFSSSFSQYYDDRADLIGTFGTKVSDDITSRFNDVADDDLADESEVPKFQDFMDEINNEKPKFNNRANTLGITTELNSYNSAYNNFSSSLYDVITANSYPFDLTSVNFRSRYQTYYDTRGDLIGTFGTKVSADTAARFDDIADDGIADESELAKFQDFMDEINSERDNLVARANTLGIVNEKNDYTGSYQAFSSSLYDVLTAGSYPFDLTSVNFKTNYKNYYTDRADLLGTFGTKVSSDITTRFNDIADDNLAEESEVPRFAEFYDEISNEKPSLELKADTLSITTEKTEYINAYDDFSSSLNSVISASSYPFDLSTVSFKTRYQTYYNKRGQLIGTFGTKVNDNTVARFNDIANDDVADKSELPRFESILDEIESERPRLESKANYLGIVNELGDYTASYDNLSGSIDSILSAGSYPYTLVNASFKTNFRQYYDDKADLVGTFGSHVSDDITAKFDDVANDDLADESELPKFQDFMDEINNEQPVLESRANTLGIGSELTDYNNAYTNFSSSLYDILTAGSYPFDLTSVNFRSRFQTYYNERGDLQGAFGTKAESNSKGYTDTTSSSIAQTIFTDEDGKINQTPNPNTSGLHLGSSHMGYWDGATWITYMDNQGDFYLTGSSGDYLAWDSSTGTLQIQGQIIITGGNAATQNYATTQAADAADVSASLAETNANNYTDNTSSSIANDIFTDSDGLIHKTPSAGGSGLYLGNDHLGYYNGSQWVTYMDDQGDFYLNGSSGYLTWDSSTDTLSIKGEINATTGSIEGSLTMGSNGEIVNANRDYEISDNGIKLIAQDTYGNDASVLEFFDSSTRAGEFYLEDNLSFTALIIKAKGSSTTTGDAYDLYLGSNSDVLIEAIDYLRLFQLPTSNPGGTNRVWRDSNGYLRIT